MTERGCLLEEPHRRRDSTSRLGIAADTERHHAAEATAHLGPRYVVARMGRQAGIVDRPHSGVRFERLGDSLGVVAARRDSQKEGPHATQQKPGLERAEHASAAGSLPANRLPEARVSRRRQGTRQNVTMAVELLGSRVHDEIDAELQRPGVNRSRQSTVCTDDRAGGVRELDCGADVGDVESGICRSLDPHQSSRLSGQRGL